MNEAQKLIETFQANAHWNRLRQARHDPSPANLRAQERLNKRREFNAKIPTDQTISRQVKRQIARLQKKRMK